MDSSLALDHFTERRDLLRGFLDEYSLLCCECPALTDMLTFDAYVQYCLGFFALRQRHAHYADLDQQFHLTRAHLPLPISNERRPG